MGELVAVTAYYNPCNWKSRYNNFLEFHEKWSRLVPLKVMEIVYDKTKLLPKEIESVKLKSKSVLWHKERLLNLGIDAWVEEGAKKIMWVDADIVYPRHTWIGKITEALNSNDFVQGFSKNVSIYSKSSKSAKTSAVPMYMHGKFGFGTPGGSWAVTANAWQKLRETHPGLYEHAIVGGGDTLFLSAIMGRMLSKRSLEARLNNMLSAISLDAKKHYLKYLASLYNSRYKVTNISDELALYLSHGKRQDRKYGTGRLSLLSKYNPEKDLVLKNNLWEFTHPTSALAVGIAKYFKDRKEDD